MRISPINNNYPKPIFKSKFVSTKEFDRFQEILAKTNNPSPNNPRASHQFIKNYAEVFKLQYEKFLNDGKDISYKYFHKKTDLPPSKKTYNHPAVELRAVIEDENGNMVDSALMDLQIKSNESIIKPNFTAEMRLFQRFLNFPEKHEPFYISDVAPRFSYCEHIIRISRPYSKRDFVKIPFIPDL